MTDHQHIDEQFRDRQHDWDARPGDGAWNRLTDRLDDHRSGSFRRRLIYRSTAAACVASLLALSIYMFNNSFDPGGFQAQHIDLELSSSANVQPVYSQTADSAVPAGLSEPTLGAAVSKRSAQQPAESKVMAAVSSNEDDRADQPARCRSEPAAFKEIPAETLASDGPSKTRETDSKAVSGAGAGRPPHDEIDLEDQAVAAAVNPEVSTGISFDSVDETILLDEVRILTDAAVANQAGIEAQKKAHQSDSRKQKRESAAGFFEESKNPDPAERSLAEDVAAEIENKDIASEFTATTLTVLVPAGKKEACEFVSFRIQGDAVYIDGCSSGRSDLDAPEFLSADQLPLLQRVFSLGREALKEMETETRSGPCLPSVNSIQFVFRTSTTMSYFEETVRLPLQEFCLPENARPIVRDLVQLRDQFSK